MAAAGIAVTVGGGPIAVASDDEVVLGTTVPLTGAHKRSGTDTHNRYELAIRRINEPGGFDVDGKRYRLTACYYGDNSHPLKAQELIGRLIYEDGVKFILGPYHSVQNRAVLATVKRNRVPMVDAHSIARKQDNRRNGYAFAVAATPDQYLMPAREFAAAISERFGQAANDLRIAIATQDDAFSQQVRAGVLSDVRRLGTTCVIDDQLPENFADMSVTLEKIKALKPDLFWSPAMRALRYWR